MAILSVIDRAIACLECELKIVDMELAHPERFVRPEPAKPLAKWTGSIAGLLELLIALFLTGLITKPSGQKMNFAEIAGLFGTVFGIKVADLYGRKSKLLTRKKTESPFLDNLTSKYREEVENMSL